MTITHGVLRPRQLRIRQTPAPPRPVLPRGYEAIGMCCGCGFLGFVRLFRDALFNPRAVCSDCEGVARPQQPGELPRIEPRSARSAVRARKADAA